MKLYIFLLILLLGISTNAKADEDIRRVISPTQPAWIIHIDVWNYADPQKIIDMVPEDVRPYVIFNIATSSSDEKSSNGPAIYDSWMKVCAQNRVWTMIQCSSGATNRMPDTPDDITAYEQYFKEYPNFIGFNFAEQFWGYGTDGNVTFKERLQLFEKLLPLCKTYGGYLAISFTDSYYSASRMPMAYLKRSEAIRNFMAAYPEYFLCFEKYTMKKGFFDIESNCLGHWLSGYAGQYGIRFDSSGWLSGSDTTDQTKGANNFVRAAGAIPVIEHMMLTGETMMDGPELTWTECSQEVSTTTTDDGFYRRNWGWFPQFNNISLDIFRKVIDGTIRIPSREEVIERTKVCLVNDITKNIDSENEKDSYLTPENLFDNLYRSADDDGGANNRWITNRWWMKSTGRYPAIPQTIGEIEGMTSFKKSTFNKEEFDAWMSQNFVEEYSGDIYAGRHENGWVTYNPYQYNESTQDGYRICSVSTKRATGVIPLQYNTCSQIQLDYAPYTVGVIREYNNKITLYLNNYRTDNITAEDVIKLEGASAEPVMRWEDRGEHAASDVSGTWNSGIYTITVKHNGPLEITLNCKGRNTDRKTEYTTTKVTSPEKPAEYTGKVQYEAELADYKSAIIRKSGYGLGHDGYYGQGFAELSNMQSTLRFTIKVSHDGEYLLTVRYQNDGRGRITVNGQPLSLPYSSEWAEATIPVSLTAGRNNILLQNASLTMLWLDAISLENKGTTSVSEPTISHTQPSAIYNLQGQQVKNPRRGIYIMHKNNKKMVIK